MTQPGVITLILAFFAFDFRVQWSDATVLDCQTYISGSQLVVPENTVCEMSSNIDVEEVEVLGQMVSANASNVKIQITCTSFTIEAGGEVNLDGNGYPAEQGPGAGNADGSGGR